MKTLLAALPPAIAPALAQEIVSPEEFRDHAENQTLHFERDGRPFGSEYFGTEGQTRCRHRDGSCVRGVRRPHGPAALRGARSEHPSPERAE